MLERMETRKDIAQVAVESAFNHVGQIAGIIARAGRDVTREIGDWATDVFEMRDAARRAQADRARSRGGLSDESDVELDHDPRELNSQRLR